MDGSTARRTLAATAAAAAAVTLAAAPASAGVSGGGEVEVARIYADDQYLLVTGLTTFDDGCSPDFPSASGHLVETPSGRYSVTARTDNPAALYDVSGVGHSDLFELIGILCSGAVQLVPLATGESRDRVHFWGSEDGSGGEQDRSLATLDDEDGTTYRVVATSNGRFESPDALPSYSQALVVTEMP